MLPSRSGFVRGSKFLSKNAIYILFDHFAVITKRVTDEHPAYKKAFIISDK